MSSPALRRVTPAAEPPEAAAPPRLRPSNGVAAAPAERTARAAASGVVDDVALLVRQRRIQFDLDREYVDATSGRIAAGWTVRFFALHDKGAHAVPACPCCRRLGLELRRLAAAVLCDGGLEADVEIGVVTAALYDSRTLPNRDEVALAVRLWPRAHPSQRPGGEDGPIRALRRRLKRLGVAES